VQRHAADTALVLFAQLDLDEVELAALCPAHVHAHEHRGPVTGVDTARSSADLEEGAHLIARASEHDLELEVIEGALGPVERRVDVIDDLRELAAFLGHLKEEIHLFEAALQSPHGLDHVSQTCQLTDQPLALVLVIPEIRAGLQRLDLLEPFQLDGVVKDSPSAD